MAELSNVDIVVYALYLCGGASQRVLTEDVALNCYRLAPERFSWKKYPEYPDIEPARVALFDGQKEKHGRLAKGDARRGWILTPSGIDRAKAIAAKLSDAVQETGLSKSDHQERQRALNELEKHQAFQKYKKAGNCDGLEWYEFTDFLRCLVDTTPRKLVERLDTYRSQAYEAGREEILSFIEACEKRFKDRLGR